MLGFTFCKQIQPVFQENWPKLLIILDFLFSTRMRTSTHIEILCKNILLSILFSLKISKNKIHLFEATLHEILRLDFRKCESILSCYTSRFLHLFSSCLYLNALKRQLYYLGQSMKTSFKVLCSVVSEVNLSCFKGFWICFFLKEH